MSTNMLIVLVFSETSDLIKKMKNYFNRLN